MPNRERTHRDQDAATERRFDEVGRGKLLTFAGIGAVHCGGSLNSTAGVAKIVPTRKPTDAGVSRRACDGTASIRCQTLRPCGAYDDREIAMFVNN